MLHLRRSSDAFNESAVTIDIKRRFPALSSTQIKLLVGYGVAGAGMANAMRPLLNISNVETDQTRTRFRVWLDGRNLTQFNHNLFVTNGYRCEQVPVVAENRESNDRPSSEDVQ